MDKQTQRGWREADKDSEAKKKKGKITQWTKRTHTEVKMEDCSERVTPAEMHRMSRWWRTHSHFLLISRRHTTSLPHHFHYDSWRAETMHDGGHGRSEGKGEGENEFERWVTWVKTEDYRGQKWRWRWKRQKLYTQAAQRNLWHDDTFLFELWKLSKKSLLTWGVTWLCRLPFAIISCY